MGGTTCVTGSTAGTLTLSTDKSGGALASRTFSFYRHPQFQIYKFIPAATSTYKYVSECSNRGTCDYANGICNCFPGYSSDDILKCHWAAEKKVFVLDAVYVKSDASVSRAVTTIQYWHPSTTRKSE